MEQAKAVIGRAVHESEYSILGKQEKDGEDYGSVYFTNTLTAAS